MAPSDDSAIFPSEPSFDTDRAVGLLAALPEELGPYRSRGCSIGRPLGVRIHGHGAAGTGVPLLTALSGVGKVAAAHAAAALLDAGALSLLVVGTCGGLRRGDEEGAMVVAGRCIQWDLGVREGREPVPDARIVRLWREVVPDAMPGVVLTADRAALRWIDRARRARTFRAGTAATQRLGVDENETVVADMETAAVGAVAERAGVPFAALRVISDARTGPWRGVARRLSRSGGARETLVRNLGRFGGRPAETVAKLLPLL